MSKNKLVLSRIEPLNPIQDKVLKSNKNLIVCGAAGTGKTFLLLYKGLELLERGVINKVLIIRSAVATRNVGYLPGSLQEKTKVFELPYEEICINLYETKDAYKQLKMKKEVEFMSTSYVRGINLDDCFIIVDEFQNLSFHELDSIITRVGENTIINFCGDIEQSDLADSGLKQFKAITDNLPQLFDTVEFGLEHIVRSDFVKAYLIEKDRQKNASRSAK